MKPFTVHTGIVGTLDRVNVDTDQIIPKQFLKRIERTGFEDALFFDWRFKADGSPNPEFELNQPRFANASVFVDAREFWLWFFARARARALENYGFRVVIAPSFADIFFNNCFKNGMLPIRLSEEQVEDLFQRTKARDGYQLTVDLNQQTITDNEGLHLEFEVDAFRKHCLLNGLDDIGLTLQHEDKIAAFEAKRASGQ